MKSWLLVVSLLASLLGQVLCQQQYTSLPITLYRSTYGALGPKLVEYFAVTVCDDSCAYNRWASLSIAIPDNPTWNMNQPLVIVELSKCKNSFDVNCVFATNYFWGKDIFGQVEWDWTQYLDSTKTFYMRFTGPIATLTYSFEIQFKSSGSMKSGFYDTVAFGGAQVPSNTVYNRLKQMVRLQESAEVNNFQTDVYFVQFCVADFPSNCDKDAFRVVASATSTADRPMSQFNLYACPAKYGSGCGIYLYEVADTSTIGVVQVDVTNGNTFNTTDGLYFSIYGLGGEPDQINEYIFNVRLYLQ